jgi:hypothetical protein
MIALYYSEEIDPRRVGRCRERLVSQYVVRNTSLAANTAALRLLLVSNWHMHGVVVDS